MASAWGSGWGSSWGSAWGKPQQTRHLLPQPEGYTFADWGARVSEEFAHVAVASPIAEDKWKDWVCSLHYEPGLAAMNIPSPEGFATWQAWAASFCDAVR